MNELNNKSNNNGASSLNNITGNDSFKSQGTFTSQQIPNNMSDEELLKVYVGNNYDKLTKRHFNFAAFFLSDLYMFYRKMYLQGLIVDAISICSIYAFFFIKNEQLILLLSLIVRFVIGFIFNKLYLKKATSEIKKIKETVSNGDFNIVRATCVSKGGTSIVATIIMLIVISIIFSIIIAIFGLNYM